MGIVEDWRTMTQGELNAVVREMAQAFHPQKILQPADLAQEGDTVDTVDENLGTVTLKPRERVIVTSTAFPRFRLAKRISEAGRQILILQVKPRRGVPWRNIAAVRVSKRERVIDEEEP